MATKLTVVEVVASGNGTGVALAAAHGEELLEGARSGDGRLVGAGVGTDLVGAAVRGDGAEAGGAAARVVAAVVLDDVVLGLGGVELDGVSSLMFVRLAMGLMNLPSRRRTGTSHRSRCTWRRR